MRATLADSLKFVLPVVPERLVSADLHDDLLGLARRLAPVVRGGFEVRLGPSQEVDFQQGILAREDEPRRLHEHLRSSPLVGDERRPLSDLLDLWLDTSSPFHERIQELWLEFDRPPASSLSVFVGLARKMPLQERRSVAHKALDALGGIAGHPGSIFELLDRCLGESPPGAYVSHLGVMLGRSVPFLRVNIKHLEPAQIPAYLSAVGWPEPGAEVARLAERFRALTDGVTVCLDIGEAVSGRLGLECHLDEQPPGEPRWSALLDELVARGWCSVAKKDALLGWPGRTTPIDAPEPWPAHLVHAELRRPPHHFTSLERELSHIKLTYEPDGEPHAKAYFGYFHAWLRPGLDPRGPRRAPPQVRQSGGGVVEAVRAATAFLVDARTRAGWWVDFSASRGATDDLIKAFGWSDEWVTAFVGTALGALPDVRAREAARLGWRLLVERRLPLAGFGFNRSAPVDADSTAWALRLARVTGMIDTEPAYAARRVLLLHEQADGGLTTYRPEECPRPRELSLRPPNGSYDGWCRTSHPCVTAAAATVMGERQLEYLRRVQRPDGAWDAYWWESDEYATALAAEALHAGGRSDDALLVDAAVTWGLARVSLEGADESAFATAWGVRLLRLREDEPPVRERLRRAVDWLVARQEVDGAWTASASLVAPRPDLTTTAKSETHPAAGLDDSRIFTTATVLSALAGEARR